VQNITAGKHSHRTLQDARVMVATACITANEKENSDPLSVQRLHEWQNWLRNILCTFYGF